MRKLIWVSGLLALALVFGLVLPGGVLYALDGRLARSEWAIAETGDKYQYDGTLENRVRALAAYRGGSPSVHYTETDGEYAADVWNALYAAGLLPVGDDGATCESYAFRLTPARVNAEYDFYDIVCVSGGNRLHAVVDADTGAYLQIDFTCAPDMLSEWMRNAGEGFYTVYKYNELMESFAELNGFARLNDLGGNYLNGEVIQGFEADVEGTLFMVSLKYSLSQGLLMYNLSARPLS